MQGLSTPLCLCAFSSCSWEVGSFLRLFLALSPELFFSPSLSFLANFTPTYKENGETGARKGARGGGSEWESRSPGERYLVSELLCVVTSGAKKLEFVSREKSALSETHWLPEKLCCHVKDGLREGKKRRGERQPPDLARQGETLAEAPGILG